MQDFFGNVLELGDEVALTPHGYKNLTLGTIVDFTPLQVRVQYDRKLNVHVSEQVTILRYPQDLVKKPANNG